VFVDGDLTDRPEARRGRVRALVALLALAGPLRREWVTDLMWPDLDPAAAARNLRVTLSRVRHLLEPDRQIGRACRTLRFDPVTLGLASPPHVHVDLWELKDHLAAADAAERSGDPGVALGHLEQAVALWRGDPLDDVAEFVEMAGEVEHVRRTLLDATLRLGELRLVAGQFGDALQCADRVRRADPYAERAHRLTVAALLQRRDHEAVRAAVAEVESTFGVGGVGLEPATQMLLRQARARLGLAEVAVG
jgi:DNA-binding SARP family transcriptional activator